MKQIKQRRPRRGAEPATKDYEFTLIVRMKIAKRRKLFEVARRCYSESGGDILVDDDDDDLETPIPKEVAISTVCRAIEELLMYSHNPDLAEAGIAVVGSSCVDDGCGPDGELVPDTPESSTPYVTYRLVPE